MADAGTPAAIVRRGVSVSERSIACKVNLRGAGGDPAFAAAVAAALGVSLPLVPNTVSATGPDADARAILWLGPDEWLVVDAGVPPASVVARLREGLAGHACAVTDVSDGRLVFRVAGERAREVLARGCPIDLHPAEFGPGRCAQTLLDRLTVIVHAVDAGPTFDVYVARSFAAHARLWFGTATREYE